MPNTSYKSIFAIGDIHGCNTELRLLLQKLPLSEETLVVFLGDYIDRGSDSKGVIDTILELKTRIPVVTLKGNHEDMFLDFLKHPESPGAGMFIFNGGSATLSSYEASPGHFEVPREHLKFFNELKHCFETEHYFFVHAGVPNVPLRDLDVQLHGDQMMWIRSAFLNSNFHWEKQIVHGHTPVETIEILPNRVNVDTGCVYDNKLTAIELPEYRVYSVDKQNKAEAPRFMRNPKSPNRVAERFQGALRVFVERGGFHQVEFETLNYTQFGLLIRHNLETGDPYAVLQIGEEIVGTIESDKRAFVQFRGIVVRTEVRESDVLYGVKINQLSAPGDTL